jgi:hypothetical protein
MKTVPGRKFVADSHARSVISSDFSFPIVATLQQCSYHLDVVGKTRHRRSFHYSLDDLPPVEKANSLHRCSASKHSIVNTPIQTYLHIPRRYSLIAFVKAIQLAFLSFSQQARRSPQPLIDMAGKIKKSHIPRQPEGLIAIPATILALAVGCLVLGVIFLDWAIEHMFEYDSRARHALSCIIYVSKESSSPSRNSTDLERAFSVSPCRFMRSSQKPNTTSSTTTGQSSLLIPYSSSGPWHISSSSHCS